MALFGHERATTDSCDHHVTILIKTEKTFRSPLSQRGAKVFLFFNSFSARLLSLIAVAVAVHVAAARAAVAAIPMPTPRLGSIPTSNRYEFSFTNYN